MSQSQITHEIDTQTARPPRSIWHCNSRHPQDAGDHQPNQKLSSRRNTQIAPTNAPDTVPRSTEAPPQTHRVPRRDLAFSTTIWPVSSLHPPSHSHTAPKSTPNKLHFVVPNTQLTLTNTKQHITQRPQHNAHLATVMPLLNQTPSDMSNTAHSHTRISNNFDTRGDLDLPQLTAPAERL
jgi:hypothetical protein